MKCPVCGSTKVIENPITGELVCKVCGTVIDENPIDDRDYYLQEWGNYNISGNRLRRYRLRVIAEKLAAIDSSSWGKHKTRDILSIEDREKVEFVRSELLSKILPKYKIFKSRTLNALAFYIVERSEGMSKTGALKTASEKTGVSLKTLERIIREYRDSLEDAIRRAAIRWRTE